MENKWLQSAVDIYKEYFGESASIVIDIGTRDGDDAEFFREKLNATDVYAIDANPIAIKTTRERYPDFKVFETAISDYNGTTSFTQIIADNKDMAGCSSIVAVHNFGTEMKQITVPVVTLDKFFEDNNLSDEEIDIIKVDTEGFSYQVLKGMGDKIHNVKLFHLETETFKRHPGHMDNEEVKAFMEFNGFTLKDTSYEWGPTIEDRVWINLKLL